MAAGKLVLLLGSVVLCSAQEDAREFFETRVRPVLANNCYACHTASQLGGLRLDSRESLLQGGKSGPAIAPGQPEESLLLRAVRHTDPRLKMPLAGNKLKDNEIARNSDGPIAALLQDLKERGLLGETLVLIGSEFGRTPVVNLGGFRSVHNGRDHNVHGFTVLLAGGGAKPGTIYGATDDFGFKVAENPVHVHDLHATVLHLLGLDREKLTYRYSGRDFRLTDVEGRVVKDIIT